MNSWRTRLMGVPLEVNFGALSERAAASGSRAQIVLGEPLNVAPAVARQLDHAQLALIIDALARRLRAEGVTAGSCVVVVKANNFDIIALAAAVMRLGAVPALLSPTLDEHTLAALLGRLNPGLVITDATAQAVLASKRRLLQVSAETPLIGPTDLGEIPTAPSHVAPGQIAVITHTSGTTGIPKLVGHSTRSILSQGGVQVPIGRMLLRRKDRIALCLPWAHTRSLAAYVAVTFLDRSIVAISDPHADHIRDLLNEHRPTYLEAVPDNFQRWEHLADDRTAPFQSVRVFFSTFDAIHPRTVRRLLAGSRRRLPLYVQVYGQSETAGVTVKFYTRRKARRQQIVTRNVGRPVWPFVRMRVVDPNTGRRCRAGRPGNIQIQSPGLLVSYVGDDQLAQTRRQDNWWTMTDRGYMTRLGFLHFLDRDIDAVEEVNSTLAVEDALLDRLTVCDDVVVVPDSSGALVGIVSLRPGGELSDQQWRQATRDLPLHRKPLVLDRDRIPRTMTGKVRRPQLRRELDALVAAAPS